MRRLTLWILGTISTLVLLFSYQSSISAGHGTSTVAAAPAAVESSAPAATGSSAAPGATTTIDGDVVPTRYGNVQVRITVENGKVTSSSVLQVPWSNGRDRQINAYAVPILNAEAVSAQSAGIDMVSGATYTSEGYIQSLQSALDRAHR